MRERLIELIINSVGGCARNWAETIADHLLENGVIVPPCKVGDTVYVIEPCTCHDNYSDYDQRDSMTEEEKIQYYRKQAELEERRNKRLERAVKGERNDGERKK